MSMKVHLKGDKDAPTAGLFGQVSFERIVNLMRASGHIGPHERVTDLVVNVKDGVVSYKIES